MIYKNKRNLLERHVSASDVVLDVGFSGQGIKHDNPDWPHGILLNRAKEVYGLDIELDSAHQGNSHYVQASAENFSFPVAFDVIVAGDLIEHLSNPGKFLDCALQHLKPNGKLVLTTPNTFNLFNMAEKLTKREPTVNPDHTFYFNSKVLVKLLEKNGMSAEEVSYLYTLGYDHRESWKKKTLNVIYWFLSLFTDKFVETLVVVAKVKPRV